MASNDSIEIERKWLVDAVPDLAEIATSASELRQGYLAIDGYVTTRVRDAGPDGCRLTVKSGVGAERLELEWPISVEQFEMAWAATGDRRIHKTRYRIPLDAKTGSPGHIAELDIFHGSLEGVVLVEVEFDSTDAMEAFVAPDWFGEDVTDRGDYTNSRLSVNGRP